ncbi:MAG: IS6 family transposase [Chloroflexi bacterium]|nr:IS6 family transposase [Chloroflexota bacterium]
MVKYGSYKGVQRYWCKTCRRKFADNDALPGRRVPPEQVGAAVSMFYKGLSYQDIRQQMGQQYGFSPSKSTVYEWVTLYSRLAGRELSSDKPKVGDTWVADELVLKIDGENVWVWDVMDADTRYFLASYVSPTRTLRDAQIVMGRAYRTAGKAPQVIVTDRLRSYIDGIERAFGAHTKHVQSGGIRAEVNNNLSERLQGTIRERTKVMRGLQNRETAQAFLDGWVLDYNNFRPHESLGNKTPAEVAGALSPYRHWGDVAQLQDKRLTPRPIRARGLRDRAFRVKRIGL